MEPEDRDEDIRRHIGKQKHRESILVIRKRQSEEILGEADRDPNRPEKNRSEVKTFRVIEIIAEPNDVKIEDPEEENTRRQGEQRRAVDSPQNEGSQAEAARQADQNV